MSADPFAGPGCVHLPAGRATIGPVGQIRGPRESQHKCTLTPLTPPLTPQFHAVLANWSYTDYVTAKPLVLDWIANNLAGLSLKDLAKAMNDYCLTGGEY